MLDVFETLVVFTALIVLYLMFVFTLGAAGVTMLKLAGVF